MIVKVYNDNPSDKVIRQIVKTLEGGGVIAYPTDTVYALGCSIKSPKAIERLREIKGKKATLMSIVCSDLSNLSDYAKVDTPTYKILKRYLPGGYTFILHSSSKTPEKVLQGRKTVGIRIPDNRIALEIVRELGVPLVTTSVRREGMESEYITDPSLIEEFYGELDMVVDGGYGDNFASTIVDCVGEEPEIVRQGRAAFEE
ncbi:MAG: L-threonylcarbamoyladenylate synthase [Rikenellaceae bacterium]